MAPSNLPAGARDLSTGGYVVLGLLLDGPATGWDLGQVVDRSIGHFWPLTRAHIYAELPKIAARGYATLTEVPQRGAPDRRVYTATDEGEVAFDRWIAGVELTEERGRQPLQLRLFFAARARPDRLRELLDAWRERAEANQAHCTDILRRRGVRTDDLAPLVLGRVPGTAPTDGPGNPLAGQDARAMTALFGLRRAQADLIWLHEVREALLLDR